MKLTAKLGTLPRRALTSAEFSQLEDVPPETEWFANIDNPHTRPAYRNDLKASNGPRSTATKARRQRSPTKKPGN